MSDPRYNSGSAGETVTEASGDLGRSAMPPGLRLVRTTPEFTSETVPPALLASHRVADGVWGRLRVFAGVVDFVVEGSGDRRSLSAGDSQVIEPGLLHHVEPSDGARFAVEFHRPIDKMERRVK